MAFPYVFQNNEDNEGQASGKLVNGLQSNHNCSISQDFEYEHHRYINYDQSYSSSAVTGTPQFSDLDELVSLLFNDDLPIQTSHCRSNSHREGEEHSAGEDLAEDSPAETSIDFNPVVVNGNPNIHLNCESYTGDNYEQFNPHTHDDDLYHHHHHHHLDPVSSSPSTSRTINLSHDEMHADGMGLHTNHHHRYHASMAQLPLRVPNPKPAAAAPLYNDGLVTLNFGQQPSPSPSPSPYETSNCSFTASSYGSYHNISSPLDVSSSPIGTSKKRKATKSAIDDCLEDHDQIGIIVKTNNLQLSDGYVWRKYGQKIIKNEEYSRSYFKCAQDGCTVKKHTQQQSKSEVMFTYEGKHNHAAPKL